MQYSDYLGHANQLSGVEEHRLIGGKGDGMRLFEVRNGLGLECTVVPDRCADIYRLSFMGQNMGFFSPCGYVGPAYYDDRETNWLKSFTAGFLTTCGLTAVGNPCEDEGEALPLHGTIGNIPAENARWYRDGDKLIVEADIVDARIFSRKLQLHRKLVFSTTENKITLTDTVENHGDDVSPVMVLYHMNMGYPLLSENTRLQIPSVKVTPRNDHAAKDLDTHLKGLKPTPHFEEQCYFHEFEKVGKAKMFNTAIGVGLAITFDTGNLNHFCQWKMMGRHDYVMGLEPGNCTPDGRDVMRREGKLQFLQPGETTQFSFDVTFFTDETVWENF